MLKETRFKRPPRVTRWMLCRQQDQLILPGGGHSILAFSSQAGGVSVREARPPQTWAPPAPGRSSSLLACFWPLAAPGLEHPSFLGDDHTHSLKLIRFSLKKKKKSFRLMLKILTNEKSSERPAEHGCGLVLSWLHLTLQAGSLLWNRTAEPAGGRTSGVCPAGRVSAGCDLLGG